MYRIVIITDCTDVAYSEMRGYILSHTSVPVEIEPLVPVKPLSVVNAAFLTRLMADAYPLGTIFFVVVSPGTMQRRPEHIVGFTQRGHLFIGPDTGSFTWLIDDYSLDSLYRVRRGNVSFATFGGKHILSPALGELLNNQGVPDCIADRVPLDTFTRIAIPEGTVVHIDNFGNLKVQGPRPAFEEGQPLLIQVKSSNRQYQATFGRRFMDFADMSLVVSAGSSLHGLPEIALSRGNAAAELGLDVGDEVSIQPM